MSKKRKSGGESRGEKSGKSQNKSKRSIKSSLLNFLQTNSAETFNYKQIAAQLGLNSHAERNILLECLEELMLDGTLEEKDRGKYKPVLESKDMV
ncbi:MAG: hypothetical protein EOP53_03370 [Sphingobacteriales bacterium]|nr:MAG: hypothetical protein EOP53_03370 [Sphingobacteriales bacterium]